MDGTTQYKINLIADGKRKNLFKNVEIDQKTGNVYLISNRFLNNDQI